MRRQDPPPPAEDAGGRRADEPGRDYAVEGDWLVFPRSLAKERRLTGWQWFLGAWGIGTYGKHDTVDVAWDAGGAPQVAHALDVEPVP